MGRDEAPKPLNCDGVQRHLDAGQKVGIVKDIDDELVAKEDPGGLSPGVALRLRGAAGDHSRLVVARGEKMPTEVMNEPP